MRMRKALSVCFLLGLLIAIGCAKKKVKEEPPPEQPPAEATATDQPATEQPPAEGAEPPAEGCAPAAPEGCAPEAPAAPEGCAPAAPEGCAPEAPAAPEGCAPEAPAAPEGCAPEAPAAPEGCAPEAPAAPEGCAPAAPEGCAPETPAAPEGCAPEAPAAPEGCAPEAPAAPEGCAPAAPEAQPELPPMEEAPDAELLADKERAAKLKESYLKLADAAYKAADLQKAKDLYKRVLLIDPKDQAARDAYQRVSVELGERAPVAEEILGRESDLQSARREQTIAEVKRRLNWARQNEEQGDYDKAIRYYEEILNILNWYKYQTDFPITADQTRQRIEAAKSRKELDDRRQAERQKSRIQEEEQSRAEREREEELRRMRAWLISASEAFDRGEYDLAEANARKVLDLDPHNEKAKQLVQIARETKYAADRNDIRERFSDQWRTLMEQVEQTALPHPELLNYPANWSEISRRRPPTTDARGAVTAIDPRTEQILNTLESKRVHDVDFQEGDMNLEGVITYLQSVTGENFVPSRKVREEKAQTGITLKVDNVSVRQVLELITEPNELAWKVRNGVVMILAKDEAIDQPVLQFYDVKDLVAKIQDFPGSEINLVPSKYQPPEAGEAAEPKSPFEVEQLIEVIKQTIEPQSWETVPGANVEPKNNVLVITQTPEVHRKIGQFLSDLRKNTGLLVSLEVRFLTAEDRFLRDVGVDIRGLGDQTGGVGVPGKGVGTNFDDSFAGSPASPSGSPTGVSPEPSSIGTARTPGVFYGDGQDGEYKGRVENLFDFVLDFDERGRATASAATGGVRGANSGGLSFQMTYLDDTQLEVILRAVEKSERIEQIHAPRLTIHDTQRANVSVLKQNSYVQDFDVEIAQAAAIGDPIVQTIRDGTILDVRPIVSADRRFITMELRPTVAELVRPIPTFLTTLGTGPPVTIQVPELAISRVRTTVTMPDGATLLLGGIKFFRDLDAESGVPVLSKVPILSFFFSRKAKSIQRRNLLILMKAEVVVLEERAPNQGIQ
jgi:type II secretory pathway component GspD/PulD (secretin)